MGLSPDGRLLAVVGNDRCIHVYQVESGEEMRVLGPVEERPYSVFLEDDGRTLAAGCGGGRILVWNRDYSEPVLRFQTALSSVRQLALDPEQHRVFAFGYGEGLNAEVSGWSLDTGDPLFQTELVFMGDALGYGARTGRVAVGDWGGNTVVLIDAEVGTERARFTPGRAVRALAFSPDEHRLASGHSDGTVRIWDVEEGSENYLQCLQVLDVKPNYQGARIAGAKGLDQAIEWQRQGKEVKGTLLELFADCGAILDDEQQLRLAQLQAERQRSTSGSSE